MAPIFNIGCTMNYTIIAIPIIISITIIETPITNKSIINIKILYHKVI